MTGSEAKARWVAQGLDRFAGTLAIDATISPQMHDAGVESTVAAPAAGVSMPLPTISLSGDEGLGAAASVADLEVRELLGEGGMGRVVLARQRSLRREVAVKLLKPESATPRVVASLLLEAQITGSLEHPNVVPVHALGRDADGRPLLVMKRVEGVSWREVLRAPEHGAWARLIERSGDRQVASIEVLMAVCNAVSFAHSRGVVHRDIKPENVMIGAFGEVYLVDWGIAARLGAPGERVLVGTPGYLAPEMLDGDPQRLSPCTDVYLLGATLHEVLTGRPRHDGATLYEAMAKASENAAHVYPQGTPDELAALANEACATDPTRRPPSAEAFRQRLADWLRHRGASELAGRTARRAEGLAGLQQGAAAGDADQRRAFDQLATECRFGFTEALRQWPTSASARRGLARCLRAMIEVELARGNTEGARSLLGELGELGEDSAALKAGLDELEARQRQREQEDERGRQMMRDLDEGVSSRERSLFLSILGVLLLGVGVVINLYGGIERMTVKSTVIFGLIGVSSMVLVALTMREKLAANVFNRRVLAVAFSTMFFMLLHRGSALLRGDRDVAALLADDLWMAAAVTTLAAVTVRPWFGWISSICGAAALAIPLAPRQTPLLFTAGLGGSILVALWIHRRGGGDTPAGVVGPQAKG